MIGTYGNNTIPTNNLVNTALLNTNQQNNGNGQPNNSNQTQCYGFNKK